MENRSNQIRSEERCAFGGWRRAWERMGWAGVDKGIHGTIERPRHHGWVPPRRGRTVMYEEICIDCV